MWAPVFDVLGLKLDRPYGEFVFDGSRLDRVKGMRLFDRAGLSFDRR